MQKEPRIDQKIPPLTSPTSSPPCKFFSLRSRSPPVAPGTRLFSSCSANAYAPDCPMAAIRSTHTRSTRSRRSRTHPAITASSSAVITYLLLYRAST